MPVEMVGRPLSGEGRTPVRVVVGEEGDGEGLERPRLRLRKDMGWVGLDVEGFPFERYGGED